MKDDHLNLSISGKVAQLDALSGSSVAGASDARGPRPTAANDAHIDFLTFVRAFARANAARDSRECKAANDNDTRSNLRPL